MQDRSDWSYFAGVAAGVAVAFFAAFLLLCFTCFFVVAAVLGVLFPAGAEAGACAASDNPAVASVRDRPSTAEVIVFMVFWVFLFCEAFRLVPLHGKTRAFLNQS